MMAQSGDKPSEKTLIRLKLEPKFTRMLLITDVRENLGMQYPMRIPIQRRIPMVTIRMRIMMENVMIAVQSLMASAQSLPVIL